MVCRCWFPALVTGVPTGFLRIPEIKPVMQMRVRFRLKAADGTPVEHEIYNTINRVPGA